MAEYARVEVALFIGYLLLRCLLPHSFHTDRLIYPITLLIMIYITLTKLKKIKAMLWKSLRNIGLYHVCSQNVILSKLSSIQTAKVVSVLYTDSWTKFHWEKESNLRSFLNVLLKVMFSNSNGGPSRAQNSQDRGTGFIRPVKSSAGESSFWSQVTFSYVVNPIRRKSLWDATSHVRRCKMSVFCVTLSSVYSA